MLKSVFTWFNKFSWKQNTGTSDYVVILMHYWNLESCTNQLFKPLGMILNAFCHSMNKPISVEHMFYVMYVVCLNGLKFSRTLLILISILNSNIKIKICFPSLSQRTAHTYIEGLEYEHSDLCIIGTSIMSNLHWMENLIVRNWVVRADNPNLYEFVIKTKPSATSTLE